jgi:hypothetical protein
VLFTHTDLNDARLVHSSDTHVLEDLVVDLALPCLLDNDLLTSVDQRPEGRRLRLLRGIAAESEIAPGDTRVRGGG